MPDLSLAAATAVVLSALSALPRVARGPSLFDRIIVAQLFGTSGVAAALLLSVAAPELRDVAIVFAVLAPITVVALVRLAAPQRPEGTP